MASENLPALHTYPRNATLSRTEGPPDRASCAYELLVRLLFWITLRGSMIFVIALMAGKFAREPRNVVLERKGTTIRAARSAFLPRNEMFIVI